MKNLDNVQKKTRPNLKKVNDLFQPDEYGHSKWVTIDEVVNAGLSWSNNGNGRRGCAFGVNEYNWDFKRVNNLPRGKVLQIRLAGYNESLRLNQNIRKDIVAELRKQTRSNFALDCIVPLVENDKEIDHRWGRKDHSKYEYINDITKQSIDDFQLLSHSHNQFKREQCVKCKETNVRFSPPFGKDYQIGTKEWDSVVGCEGCPLAQPELYR